MGDVYDPPHECVYEWHDPAPVLGADKRLADHELLKAMIYHVFYGNPIENASVNLAAAIERYALGLPLVTEEEAQRAMLDLLSPEDRAAWWRVRNAEILGKIR